jgi:hypothetical protein
VGYRQTDHPRYRQGIARVMEHRHVGGPAKSATGLETKTDFTGHNQKAEQ